MWVFCMDRECESRVLVQLQIFLIRFLKFTGDHKLQLHLSRNELFGVGPVVHKGVLLDYWDSALYLKHIMFYKVGILIVNWEFIHGIFRRIIGSLDLLLLSLLKNVLPICAFSHGKVIIVLINVTK